MRFVPVAVDDELRLALPGIRAELQRQLGRELSDEETIEEALRFVSSAAELLAEDFDGELGREVLLAIERMALNPHPILGPDEGTGKSRLVVLPLLPDRTPPQTEQPPRQTWSEWADEELASMDECGWAVPW